MKLAAAETRMAGEIKGGKVHLATTQFGQTTKQTHDYPEGAKMTWGVLAEQLRRDLKPGVEYDVSTYAPAIQLNGAVNTHVAVECEEAIDLLGKTVTALKVRQSIESPLGMLDSFAWLDENDMALKMELLFPGFGNLELLRADEMTAKAAADGGAELFMNTLIRVDTSIDRKNAQTIKYKLTFEGEGAAARPQIPETGMQKPGPWKDRSMELVVTRMDHARLRGLAPGAPKKGFEQYLTPNVWIKSDDPEIVKMAKQAVGDEKDPYAICDRLRRHVTKVITDKNLTVGFATASEVARNREGDCSEHGVLLAALGRSLGIPSRVVCGIVYVPTFKEADQVFGFHMWTQFYLGDQWVDFDAAQRETDCNPTHIAFAVSSMKDAAMGEFAFPLIKLMGQIKLQVLDVKNSG
jgi:hypothetical protein